MGILDFIGNTVKTLVSSPLESFKQGAAAINPIVAHPVTTITQGYDAAKTKAYTETTYSNIKSVLTTGAVTAGAVLGGGALAGSASAATKLSSIGGFASGVLKNSFSSISNAGKTLLTGGGLLIGDAILSSSNKANAAVINAPSDLKTFGTNIGGFVDNPSLETAWDIAKDSPWLTGLTVVGTGLALGTAANTLATAANTRATNNNSSGSPIEVDIKDSSSKGSEDILKALQEQNKALTDVVKSQQQNINNSPPLSNNVSGASPLVGSSTNAPVAATSTVKKTTKRKSSSSSSSGKKKTTKKKPKKGVAKKKKKVYKKKSSKKSTKKRKK